MLLNSVNILKIKNLKYKLRYIWIYYVKNL